MADYRLDLKTAPARPSLASAGTRSVSAAQKLKSYFKLLLSVPFVVAILYFGSVLYNHERVVPRGVVTVQDFYKRYGNPPRVQTLYVSGRTYYRIIGEIPAPLGFPQGNPIYIFDSNGQLVDWTGESLADADFAQRWDDGRPQSMDVPYFLEKFPPS